MPYSLVLERVSGTHTDSVQPKLSLLTSTCSVVCLLPQVYSNKLRLAASEVPGFHSLWCLGAQRKGMVIIMEKRKPNDLSPDQCLAVDTESLCKLLDCGRHTAVQIGDLAHARITMNSRVLWSVQRVKEYLYEISC